MSSDEDTFVSGHQAILDKLKFVSHAPPDIVKRPHIIGLCAVPMELAGLNVLGHHISDFLCWKMTFHREGNKDDQAWFSLVDIAAAMSEHKTRYSKVINGQAKDLSVALPFIRADSNVPNLFTAFVTELKKQADVAQQKGECLIVIVCGEVSPELDICLDTNQNKAYLRKESWLGSMLKSYSIPITIITPAIFTTGWEIRPFSGDPKEADEVSDEILDSLLAKQCGGAFAASVLGSWTQDHEASDMVPTVQGQEGQLYSQFYTGIHDCMVRNMLPFTKGHSFYFAADQDEWEMALGKRKGPLGLDHFAKKWDSVKNLDESGLAAQNGGYKFLAGAFGGSHESQLVHLNFLVRQELRGCPGEWDQPTSDLCLVALTSFLQTKYPTEERAREVFTLLEWRCSMNFVADVIVDFFVLPRPQGRVCRYWDWKEQQRIDKRVHGTGAFRMALFSEMCSRWPKIPLPAGQQRDAFRDLLYWRPLQYITSAITMKYYDPRPDGPSKRETDDAKEFMLKGIGDFIDRLAKLQRWMVKDNTQLIDLYDRWLATAKPGSIRPAWKPNSTTGRSTVDPPNAMLMEFDHMGTRDVVRPAKPAPSAVSPVLAQQRQRPAAAGMPAIAASAPSKASESSLNTTASQASSQRTVLPPATVSPAATQKTSIPSFAQQNTPAMTGNPGMPPMADEPKVTVAQQNTPAAIVKSTTTATPVHETKSAVTAGDKPEQKVSTSSPLSFYKEFTSS